MLRFLTAGESHGRTLTVILEGLPAGLEVDVEAIHGELRRRQQGYGRGARMKIEADRAEVLGGLRAGKTTGAPVCLQIANKDWERSGGAGPLTALSDPRPGHADLAGALKLGVTNFREVIERASARETAARVGAGALAKQFLRHLDCEIRSHVLGIGPAQRPRGAPDATWEEILAIPETSPLRSVDPSLEQEMMREIDAAEKDGDTLGGVFEVVAHTPPPGLGSFAQWDRRLDGRLAQAILSIPAIKAVGFGRAEESARLRGSALHDEILLSPTEGIYRASNNAGGLEGGVTNGQELRIRAFMKPLSSLQKPLRSVNLETLEPAEAARLRSDVCAVPAAGVVGEAMLALTLAEAALEKFGGDSLSETLANHQAYRKRVEHLLGRRAPSVDRRQR